MEVIIMQSEVYQSLINEIDSIKKILIDNKEKERENRWLTGEEVLGILNVSPKTLQTYRDKRMISYSQVGNKIFYRLSDIDAFLESHHIKRKEVKI